jgi:predicted esterase YcpF (UPF0227 family)
MTTILYLHGFASSPASTKAAYFTTRLEAHGVHVRCPDFNEPAFATLTMTPMLEQLQAILESTAEPVALMGVQPWRRAGDARRQTMGRTRQPRRGTAAEFRFL